MKFGISFANSMPFHTADAGIELAQTAEAAGFDSLWTVEHVVWPEAYSSEYPYSRSGKMRGDPATPLPDPLIWLSWVGAATNQIRLGTGILILPQRNPLVVAKALATLDDLSGGRVEAGVGVGWLEEEFAALGVPFAGRGRRTDEYIEVLRAVWAEDDVDFEGEFTEFRGVNINPKPKDGQIPITIGGHSPAAARRAGRLGDGFYPALTDAERLAELLEMMRDAAAEAGRDPEAVEVTAPYPSRNFDEAGERLETLSALGVSRVVVAGFLLTRPDVETAVGAVSSVISAYEGL